MNPRTRLKSHFIIDPITNCWNWFGCKFSKGYGLFWFRNKPIRAHRASWIIYKGEIPFGLHVLHKCDNPPCVNPDHLFLGTNKDNLMDSIQKGRIGSWRPYKLTEKQIEDIRKDARGSGVLGRLYGVHRTNIIKIRARTIWKSIKG